jgi:hypothetical protein
MEEPTVEGIASQGVEKYLYEGLMSKDLFLRAQYLHMSWRRYIVFLFPPFFSFVYFALMTPKASILAKILVTAVSCLFIPLMFLLQRRQLISLYKKTSYFKDVFKVVISEQGISGDSAMGHSNLGWDRFIKQKEREDFLLLYYAPNLFIIVAKEFFATPEDWNNARQLIKRQMKGKGQI